MARWLGPGGPPFGERTVFWAEETARATHMSYIERRQPGSKQPQAHQGRKTGDETPSIGWRTPLKLIE